MNNWQLRVLERWKYITYGLVLPVIAPIIDLIDLFVKFVPPAKNSKLSALLIGAIGLVFISVGKDFAAGSSVRRSILAAGFGFIVMGLVKVYPISIDSLFVRILADCIEILLFGISFFYARKVPVNGQVNEPDFTSSRK